MQQEFIIRCMTKAYFLRKSTCCFVGVRFLEKLSRSYKLIYFFWQISFLKLPPKIDAFVGDVPILGGSLRLFQSVLALPFQETLLCFLISKKALRIRKESSKHLVQMDIHLASIKKKYVEW